MMKTLFVSLLAGFGAATHLDNVDDVFNTYSFDMVKFKTKTDCQLDTYPEVSHDHASMLFFEVLTRL